MGAWESLRTHPDRRPLPPGTRDRFERAFGRDFSHVRVHDDPRAHAVAEVLAAEAFMLGGELLLVASVGDLRAGGVTLPDAGSAGAQLGFDLVVGAGPRAVAEIELRRLRAKKASELTDKERFRIAELEVAQSNPDRKAADAVLRGLGLAPDDVVLQLATETAPEENPLRLTGVGIPTAGIRFDEVSGESATLTVTFPDAAPAPKAAQPPPETAAEAPEIERNAESVPLYCIDLDVIGGALPAGGEGDLFGDEVTVGPLTFAGMQGHADVFPDRRVDLDVTLRKVACERMAWGIAIDAPGGIADTVHIHGSVQLTDSGEFEISGGAALNIDIDLLGALQVTIEKPGRFRAVAEDPTLLGLHAVLAAGELPTVHVEAGTIAGFEGAVGTLFNARSEQALAFRDFNLAALVDLGIYQFSFGDLETRKVDLDAAGKRLAVNYFEGAVEGVVTDQLSGSVSIEPKDNLVLGSLTVHLNPLSDRFGDVDLGWTSLTLRDSRLDLTWVFVTPPSADRAQPEAPSALGVTMSGLHAESATATGLHLATRLAGAPVVVSMDANGEATIFGLEIPSMELLIAEDFLMAEGAVSGESLVAQGLVARLGQRLELGFSASSKALRFEALSDGSIPFRLDDLIVEGETLVRRPGAREVDTEGHPSTPGEAVMLKENQPLRAWTVRLEGDASGSIDRSGIDFEIEEPLGKRDFDPASQPMAPGEAVMLEEHHQPLEVVVGGESVELGKISGHIDTKAAAVSLEGGRYIRDHISVKFSRLSAIVELGKPGDTPAALGHLHLERGALVGVNSILKFHDIRLDGASFEIDDLSALVGQGELIQLFPTLQELTKHTSGSVGFRALLIWSLADTLDVKMKVADGKVTEGTIDPSGRLPTSNISGDLMTAVTRNGQLTELKLADLFASKGLRTTLDITWPLTDPIDVELGKFPDLQITAFENININLYVEPS